MSREIPCVNGPMMAKSNVKELQQIEESSLPTILKLCLILKSQTSSQKLFTAESQAIIKRMTLKDKSITCKTNIKTVASLRTLVRALISKDQDYSKF